MSTKDLHTAAAEAWRKLAAFVQWYDDCPVILHDQMSDDMADIESELSEQAVRASSEAGVELDVDTVSGNAEEAGWGPEQMLAQADAHDKLAEECAE